MKWFKHDSDASIDVRLKKLMMRYGMEGYGLYWYCLEAVARNVEKHNLTFELEHDAETIAFETRLHVDHVQEVMSFMVDLGLFENDRGVVTCLKMAARTDEYTQKVIKKSNNVPTPSGQNPKKSELREENRTEQNKIEKKYSDDSGEVAQHLENKVRSNNPKAKVNITTWSKDIDLAIRMDKRTKLELIDCINWIYSPAGSFWQPNILSGKKLREKYDTIFAQMIRPSNAIKQKDRNAFTKTNYAEEELAGGFGENNI